MIREQRWTPDTCASPATGDACVIIESWDDTSDPITRVHTFVRHEKTCSFHAALALISAPDAYNRVRDENGRKNVTFSAALSIKATLLLSQFAWSYDAAGVLTVDLGANFTNQQKTNLQNACNVQFGAGKVVIL